MAKGSWIKSLFGFGQSSKNEIDLTEEEEKELEKIRRDAYMEEARKQLKEEGRRIALEEFKLEVRR